ncbi:anti-sigma factor family protein [Nocardia arizonensis]|uniref:anti-sigma factor family protein n=1 Tax=Nocardia arizonensis TaxID=1141647 RepID=UPI00194E9635|nr:Asp23/Gls24 family envelope stress response protein [Nocardia arizonensis]
MNSTTEGQDYRLPCGREVEQVWDRLDAVDAGLGDEHETSCPHCAAARDSLRALRAATAELIDEPEPTPPDLVGRIMSAVRAEARRGRALEVPTPRPGAVEVSEQAVAAVLRYAADTVSGVRARHCAVRPACRDDDGGHRVDVCLSIAIDPSRATVDTAVPLVRERVATAIDTRIGLVLNRLDVVVADIVTDRENHRDR